MTDPVVPTAQNEPPFPDHAPPGSQFFARFRIGMRARVAITFGVLSLLIAVLVGYSSYAVTRYYLWDQRESSALNRAVVDARAVEGALQADTSPEELLEKVSVSSASAMVYLDKWYTFSVAPVNPEELPTELLKMAEETDGASQLLRLNDYPYFTVAIPISDGMFVEVFPVRDLESTVGLIGLVAIFAAVIAAGIGTGAGLYAGGRIMRPLVALSESAERITMGDTSARVSERSDPDLDQISRSFNDMAEAVETRIAREQRFAANVSHELRSPLTAMVGTVEILERRMDQMPEREADLARMLSRQVHRFSDTVLDLLEISQLSADPVVHTEPLNVTELVLQLLLDRRLPEDLLVEQPSDYEPVVETDGRRLERVVANLIANAQRHGGGVRQVVVSSYAHKVRVSVDDAGPGVKVEEMERIFEPFTRGQGTLSETGAGLGLAIVREQLELIGANVRVESSEFGGARFTVEVPQTRQVLHGDEVESSMKETIHHRLGTLPLREDTTETSGVNHHG